MKKLIHPVTGRELHFGRKAPPKGRAKRMLSKYTAGAALPPAPSVVDYFTGVAALNDVLGNDKYGDCTCAGICHLIESLTAAAGSPVVLQTADALALYTLTTGFDPNNPATDQGADETQVLSYVQKSGIDGKGTHAIAGWVDLDPTNAAEVRSAAWLFGLYFGVSLPDSWTSPMPSGSGFVWTPGTPDPEQGHCVVGVGASDEGIQVDSWGFIGTITYDAIAELCVESAGGALYALITKEQIAAGKELAPTGLDWAQLEADFAAAGSAVAS